MGHYAEQYEAQEELDRKEAAKLKKAHPRDPSKWGISLEERVELLEERMNKLDGRLGG